MHRILFLGEGDLSGPARYLASVLHWAGIPFDHRPDQAKIPKAWRGPGRYGAILLSDYRYASFTPCSRVWLTDEVTRRGAGLCMIGGWASFTGLVGGYARTAIEKLLPVRCIPGDDRVNTASLIVNAECGMRNSESLQPLAHIPHSEFRIPNSLAPVVCGYHRAIPKRRAKTILALRDLRIKGARVNLGKPHPLLVRGFAGKGRTAAFLTDCAPHWAGGLVDWGRKRVTVKVAPRISTEVGDEYLKFFANLIHSLIIK